MSGKAVAKIHNTRPVNKKIYDIKVHVTLTDQNLD